MPVRPDISICIANYNGGRYVLDCLASVFAQQGNFHMEVLLHDDCSNDDSLALIRSEFPQVDIITSADNVGFCVSNNRMVAASHGRYLLLLNNDAVLRPNSLRSLLAYADAGHSDSVLGLPQYSLADDTVVDHGYRTDLFLNPVPILLPGTHEVGVATGACLWVPRQTWDAIGGFPEWFASVAEDIFLCFAARLLGYRVIVLDAPVFDHWIGNNFGGGKVVAQGLSTTVRRRALSERNKTFAMLLCYPTLILLAILPLHALLLVAEALFLLISGTEGKKVYLIYASLPSSIWRQRHQILTLRKRLMSERRCTFKRLFAQTAWTPQKLNMLLRYGLPKVR
jgi:GT2 family glycosyltransferase